MEGSFSSGRVASALELSNSGDLIAGTLSSYKARPQNNGHVVGRWFQVSQHRIYFFLCHRLLAQWSIPIRQSNCPINFFGLFARNVELTFFLRPTFQWTSGKAVCCVWKPTPAKEKAVVNMSLLLDNGVSDHLKKRLDSQIFQVRFSQISKSIVSPFTELFPGYDGKGLVRGEPGGFVFSSEYGRHAEKLFRFQPRKDDVWLMSFPRSGLLFTVPCC